jgi:SAM-dependent methyltransferase
MPRYRLLFPFRSIDYNSEILDIGSGPRSVFEEVAPAVAKITACDTLAEQYNQLIKVKRFPIVAQVPKKRFALITMFNMIDHMDDPEELLAQMAEHLDDNGRLWLYVDLDRPWDKSKHPQCFRFWQVAPLMQQFFTITACGLDSEAPNLNAFWCICKPKANREMPTLWWSTKLGVIYGRNFIRRVYLAIVRRLVFARTNATRLPR